MTETIPITDTVPAQYKRFSCGVAALDEYLQRYAKGNHKKGLGKTFVLIQEDELVGYYTISMGSVEHKSLPLEMAHGLPRYPIPVARIGRLAVDVKFKGRGFGALLLIDALKKIVIAAQVMGTFAVVVDAKGEEAKAFYKHFGFISFPNESLTLVLPMSSLISAL